jgi:hypothetical protein
MKEPEFDNFAAVASVGALKTDVVAASIAGVKRYMSAGRRGK